MNGTLQTNPAYEATLARLIRNRLDYVFDQAWFSIAVERGWRVDALKQHASRRTIATRLYFAAKGL